MTTQVARTPLSSPYVPEPVNVIVSQKGCDQGQVISSKFNPMEMTEVEYTHLQNIIQSHMEDQDGAEEVQLNPQSSSDLELANSCRVCLSSYTSPEGQTDASSSSSLPTDVQFASAYSNRESEDSKEEKMLLYSDPTDISSLGAITPTSNDEVSSSVLAKMRCVMRAVKERHDHQKVLSRALRPKPPARVCLEKRFNHDACDLTTKHKPQAAELNV